MNFQFSTIWEVSEWEQKILDKISDTYGATGDLHRSVREGLLKKSLVDEVRLMLGVSVSTRTNTDVQQIFNTLFNKE